MIEKINKCVEQLKIEYPDYSIELIENHREDCKNNYGNLLLIKNSDIVAIFEFGINEELEQVDITKNMLGLINNIRRKNLCVL